MTNAEKLYQDIIHQSRPESETVFRKHPRMKLDDRAKIFAPFAALRGLNNCLDAEGAKMVRQSRIELNEDDFAILSDKMVQVKKGMKVAVVYFKTDSAGSNLGRYHKITGTVLGLDFSFRALKMECGEERNMKPVTTVISMDNIVDISGDGIVGFDPLKEAF